MAYQISQTLTAAPTPAPNRNTNTPSEFSDNVDAQLSWQRTNVSENTTLITQQNALSTAVEGYSTDAETAQTAAEAARDIAVTASGATVYAAGTTYTAGDIVLDPSNNYTSYTSQTGSNTGNTPSSDDGTNWRRTITSQFTQIADASLGSGTHIFNYQTGDMQQLTATGDITLAVSNFPSGVPCGFIIDAVNFGAHIITHPASWLFGKGVTPVYTSGGTDRLMLFKDKDDVYTLSVLSQDIKVV